MAPPSQKAEVYTIPTDPGDGDPAIAWVRGSDGFHSGVRHRAIRVERDKVVEGAPWEYVTTLRTEAIIFYNPNPTARKLWQLCTAVDDNPATWNSELLSPSLTRQLRTQSSPGEGTLLSVGDIFFTRARNKNFYPAIVNNLPGGKSIEMRWLGGRYSRNTTLPDPQPSTSTGLLKTTQQGSLIDFTAGGPMMLNSEGRPVYPAAT